MPTVTPRPAQSAEPADATHPADPTGAQRLCRDVVVRSPKGLHARPATDLATLAAGFACDITLDASGQSADAKSVLNLMMLAAVEGTQLTLITEGADAAAAADAVSAFFVDGFGEL